MTLESLIVIPVFLSVMLVMITMIRFIMAGMIMQHAVSDTVKQVSVQIYPVKPVVTELVGDWQDWFAELPPSVNTLLSSGVNFVEKQLWKLALMALIKQHVEGTIVADGKFHIVDVQIPSDANGDLKFGAVVAYEMEIRLPFYHKTWVIHKHAYERVWTGG